jgi:molybdopterin synthase sulfur carrier subunit
MISVKYFGSIAEKTNSVGEEFSFSDMPLSNLLLVLEHKYELDKLSFSIAINQKIVQNKANYMLKNNDIVALLPPFSGG